MERMKNTKRRHKGRLFHDKTTFGLRAATQWAQAPLRGGGKPKGASPCTLLSPPGLPVSAC